MIWPIEEPVVMSSKISCRNHLNERASGMLQFRCLFRHNLLVNRSSVIDFWAFSLSVRNFIDRVAYKGRTKRKSKAKKGEEEEKIFNRDIVSSVCNILRYSSWEDARDQLPKLDVRWDSHIVNRVLKAHPPMEKAWLFFNWASRIEGFKHDHFTYTTMLDIFGEAGRIKSMQYVFDKMRDNKVRIDAVTYTSVMHWMSSSGDINGAVNIWVDMKRNGCCPTVVSYTAYLKILLDNGRVDEATQIYKEMIESGIQPTCHTYTILMAYLFSAGKCLEALVIFNEMQDAGVQPDKAACNILVERCCKLSDVVSMTKIMLYMRDNGVVLRYPVFLEALRTLNDAGESDDLLRLLNPHITVDTLHAEVLPSTISNDEPIDRVLVLCLLEKRNLVAVDCLVQSLMERNRSLDSWIVSTIIEENSFNSRPDGALLAFEYSLKQTISIERTAFLSLIGSVMKSSDICKVVGIVEEMIKSGHSLGTYLAALLIYKLGSAEGLSCATKIFNLLPDDLKCTAAYTALIGICFATGNTEKALSLYQAMKTNNIKFALGSYNVLLGGLRDSDKRCELELCIKEKRKMMTDINYHNNSTSAQKICDILFYSGKMTVN